MKQLGQWLFLEGRLPSSHRYYFPVEYFLMSSAHVSLCKAFFALRLSKLFLGSYKYIGAACTGISFIRFIATIYLTVTGITAKSFEDYRDTFGWLITTTFVVGAAVDIVIAGSMMYYLSRKRGKAMERCVVIHQLLLSYVQSIVLNNCLQDIWLDQSLSGLYNS